MPRQNALLEARVRRLEAEKLDRVRRELIVEIQREREQARERAAQQRRELRIEVVRPDEDAGSEVKRAEP